MSMPFGYFRGIDQALVFAATAHKGVSRKESNDGHLLPYIFHPVEVAKKIWGWGLGEELMLKAAVLHDVVEDCPGFDLDRYDHQNGYGIKDVFGQSVADLVMELTLVSDKDWTPEQARRAKQDYIKSFKNKSLAALVMGDFLFTNPKYAYKYFHKADPIYQAAHDRQMEFMDAYGEEVVKAIAKDYNRLCEDLNAESFIPLFD